MKKWIYISLVLMLIFLTACGAKTNTADTADTPNTAKPEETETVTETDEVVSSAVIDYYSLCTNEDSQTVESFAATVRQQILDKDWSALADNIAFPITVGDRSYANKDEFVAADWSSILSAEFFESIENESCENLFCNYQGIMLGNGEVWISEPLDASNKSMGLKVIAINA